MWFASKCSHLEWNKLHDKQIHRHIKRVICISVVKSNKRSQVIENTVDYTIAAYYNMPHMSYAKCNTIHNDKLT